jgi:hypothetical protein
LSYFAELVELLSQWVQLKGETMRV